MISKPSVESVAGLAWFKSSYSTSDGPECVEVASAPGTVHVRDSKDKAGAQLAFASGPWAAFVPFAASR
ncbi:DUF397 domain-containing protein [Streptomyces lunaelactis]|uniref:DUF397 domain-containing protein n=1 Tax=Streptomyces lunaelactis TaxID=1535768 RepID=UPI001584502A|nr:DUF397 domain-containing protein [Streptomyces lunaelactis]NUK11533.1 DUF397 domain-containing protein [Streptomyces lunaelactis]NUK37949.1 DUF397 domain-containing protein [Streptomyces lunaelactis]NUK44874.1 DUF397 domain-containing protein [Streptomyces lunaelactis]NUK75003.1 DUF397 domain-containing protein [Streptomyces lunaelactis]NUK78914.1 DUF397 domain-containing protein [Streptomyces lunaelactis]